MIGEAMTEFLSIKGQKCSWHGSLQLCAAKEPAVSGSRDGLFSKILRIQRATDAASTFILGAPTPLIVNAFASTKLLGPFINTTILADQCLA